MFFRWRIHIAGPAGTLYDGEEFVLQFKFNSKYPFDSPQVICIIGAVFNVVLRVLLDCIAYCIVIDAVPR